MDTDPVSSLQRDFGFTTFRPGQAEAIGSLKNNQHTLVVMPTGAGKSLIYQLAALSLPDVTLVISPLIALMKDQVDSLERRRIAAAFINSTLSTGEQICRLRDLVAGKYRLVYVAPERLRSAPFQEALHQRKVSLLAIDEAHCISEWGHDFRPDYLHIARSRSEIGNPLTVALTATATPQVQDDIIRLLNLSNVQRIVTGFNRPNLAFEVQYVANLSARLKALQQILLEAGDGGVIIYTGTRRDAEEVAEFVCTGISMPAEYYHAGLQSEVRARIQEAFVSGKLPVVVATNAFGMGIDRPDVRQVIHYSIPGSLESYYQEAGRAGRDGLPARAVLLYFPEDRALQEWFIENSAITVPDLRMIFEAVQAPASAHQAVTINDLSARLGLSETKVKVGLAQLERAGILQHPGDEGLRMRLRALSWDQDRIQTVVGKLKQHQNHRKDKLMEMVAYAESNQCRRAILLKHFGDPGTAEADVCCDNCHIAGPVRSSPTGMADRTEAERIALVLLDAVGWLKQGLGREKVAKILKGSMSQDLYRFGYDRSPFFGNLNAFTLKRIIGLLDQLLGLGYLKVIGGKYPVLRLTPRGQAAVKKKEPIPLQLPRWVNDKKSVGIEPEQPTYSDTRKPGEQTPQQLDPVNSFLSHDHPRPLSGPWDEGWALGFHSRFSGADWQRSETGELAYRLKYQGDLSVLPAIVEQTLSLLAAHSEFAQVDAIIPVPPSTPREQDPVRCFAQALSRQLNLSFRPAMVKSRQTRPQKEMHSLAQKQTNVAGAFKLISPVQGLRLLIVDDLFDSGATMAEVTRVLRRAGASRVFVLTMTRTIHTSM